MNKFFLFSCVIPNLSAALIKRKLFERVNGLSDKYLVVADWEFWLDTTEETDFYYVSEPLNYFRQHATTIRSSIKMKTQIIEIFKMFYNHISKNELTPNQKHKLKVGAGAVWFSYFVENKKTLVGFGDFSQQHGLVEKHPTAPIQKFKHELRKYCDVIDIYEWGTSKTCNLCKSPIELYKNKVIRKKKDGTYTKARISQINSVIRCKLNECKLCGMDRDINASKNMLFLLQLQKAGKKRPECFLPSSKEVETPTIINCDTPSGR